MRKGSTMDTTEVGRLLVKITAYDPRLKANSDLTIAAWAEALADVPYRVAMAAVTRHYETSDRLIMPVHVIKLAPVIKQEQEDDAAFVAWLSHGEDPVGIPDDEPMPAYLGAPRSFAEALSASTEIAGPDDLDPAEWNRRVTIWTRNNPGKTLPEQLDTAGRGPAAARAVAEIRAKLDAMGAARTWPKRRARS